MGLAQLKKNKSAFDKGYPQWGEHLKASQKSPLEFENSQLLSLDAQSFETRCHALLSFQIIREHKHRKIRNSLPWLFSAFSIQLHVKETEKRPGASASPPNLAREAHYHGNHTHMQTSAEPQKFKCFAHD